MSKPEIRKPLHQIAELVVRHQILTAPLRFAMLIERFEFSPEGFELFFGFRPDRGVSIAPGSGAKVTVWTEDRPTIAFDEGVVGLLVGKTEDGVPACRALYSRGDGSFRHGPLQILTAQ